MRTVTSILLRLGIGIALCSCGGNSDDPTDAGQGDAAQDSPTQDARATDARARDARDLDTLGTDAREADAGGDYSLTYYLELDAEESAMFQEYKGLYEARLTLEGIRLEEDIGVYLCAYEAPSMLNERCEEARNEPTNPTEFESAKTSTQSFYIVANDPSGGTRDVFIFAERYEGFLYGVDVALEGVESRNLASSTFERPVARRRSLVFSYANVDAFAESDFLELFRQLEQERVNQLVVSLVGAQTGVVVPPIDLGGGVTLDLGPVLDSDGLVVLDSSALPELIRLAALHGVKLIPGIEHPGRLFRALFPVAEFPSCYAANMRSIHWAGCSEIEAVFRTLIATLLDVSQSDEISIWNDEGGVLIYAVRDYMDMISRLVGEYSASRREVKLRYLTTESTRLSFVSDIYPDLAAMSPTLSSVDLYDGWSYRDGVEKFATYNIINYESSPDMIDDFAEHDVALNMFVALERSQWNGVGVPYATYMQNVASFMERTFEDGADVGISAFVSSFVEDASLFWFGKTGWYGAEASVRFSGQDLERFEGVADTASLFSRLEASKLNFILLNNQMFRTVNAVEAGRVLAELTSVTATQTDELRAEVQAIHDDLRLSAGTELRFELNVLNHAARAFDRLIRFRDACDSGDAVEQEVLRRDAREEATQFAAMVGDSGASSAAAYLATYWESATKIKAPFFFMFKAGDSDMFSRCIGLP